MLQAWVISELLEPSNRQSLIGVTKDIDRYFFSAKLLSTKQRVEPESISAFILEFFMESDAKFTNNESGLQRVEVLRQINSCA
jgi:hypothetical protein